MVQLTPLFDYEQLLYDELQQHKHILIKKVTGLGVTEFMLRYMADSNLGNKQMCMVTGPRIQLSITLIDRKLYSKISIPIRILKTGRLELELPLAAAGDGCGAFINVGSLVPPS